MRDLLENIFGSIVDHPERLRIYFHQESAVLRFTVSAVPGDIGRIIGKKGRNVQAIRVLLIAVAARA
jgi:uncharacterized protein